MKRVKQITDSHCGPAVLKMLLSVHGVQVLQRTLARAGEVEHSLKTHGMTVPQMAIAIEKVAPQLQFWYKDQATIQDLHEVVINQKHPAGVEWQGVFEEYTDEDNGHYAVVTHLDTVNNVIVLSDPFFKYAGTDRHFPISEFDHRWWDVNEIKNPQTDMTEKSLDYHMMFIVTPKHAAFPEELGMIQG